MDAPTLQLLGNILLCSGTKNYIDLKRTISLGEKKLALKVLLEAGINLYSFSFFIPFYWSKRKIDSESKSQSTRSKLKRSKSADRDATLAQVETEKKMSFIRAWEEGEKSKADNKAQKKKAVIAAWENKKRASLEADLKKVEHDKIRAVLVSLAKACYAYSSVAGKLIVFTIHLK
ncbi:remorin-like isoform X2 [Canna indica]|uniref:Remorin-like isoform X2 n=1 Tax=Canna indica TaxID=4628 RepID=A0AAQ3KFJ9_9LILI|nr:remorin-like isoform X2 [Canna indica]